jgi:cyanophycin synthetase
VSFRDWRISEEFQRIAIAIEFEEEKLVRAVVETLRRWLDALVVDEPVAVSDDWTRLSEYAYEVRLGNTTGAIVSAASARGIPFYRLDGESLVQLGQGRYQRRIRGATTDRTSAIASSVATDKQLTKQLLRNGGIPVPNGRLVSDAKDACRAACEIGWPVVVKPCDTDYGDGVSIRLTSIEEVREAFANAKAWSNEVLVESYVPGTLFRLLIIDNRLVGAVRRESPYVIGDGHRTIRELVEEANHEPYREEYYPSPLKTLLTRTSNVEPFARDGRLNDTVVEQGRTIALRRDIFLRSGGTQLDRTADVHPEIARLATDATRIIGLDIAGLDVLVSDISQVPNERNFVVLEVNPEPAIILHMSPLCQPARSVGAAIVESLFPPQQTGCIPLIAVLGSPSSLEISHRIATDAIRGNQCVGLASRQGSWLFEQQNGELAIRQLEQSCDRLGEHTRRLLLHPRTDCVIVLLTVDDIVREGLPFYSCDRLIEIQPHLDHHEAIQVDPSDRQRAIDCLRATLKRD